MASESKWEPSNAPGGWTKRKIGCFELYASKAQHRATVYANGEMIHEAWIGGHDQGSAQVEAETALRKLLTEALDALNGGGHGG